MDRRTNERTNERMRSLHRMFLVCDMLHGSGSNSIQSQSRRVHKLSLRHTFQLTSVGIYFDDTSKLQIHIHLDPFVRVMRMILKDKQIDRSRLAVIACNEHAVTNQRMSHLPLLINQNNFDECVTVYLYEPDYPSQYRFDQVWRFKSE